MSIPRPCPIAFVAAGLTAGLAAGVSGAQTQYYNLDGGRPGRVEDAESIARYALAADFAPFQLERLTDGTMRYRAEPKIAYGVLPFTEIEARVPIVRVDPTAASGARSSTGVASVAVGALHAFNVETSLPAVALGGEVALPIGTLAGPRAAYLLKGLSTTTTRFGRFHFNGGAGTYSVRVATVRSDSAACTRASGRFTLPLPGQQVCSSGPPVIFDSPCDLHPAISGTALQGRTMCMSAPATDTAAGVAPRTHGFRWLAGAGVDHAFALQSTLVTADLVAERFVGLYTRADWTAEAGLRHQLTPTLMINGGVGWHFAGVIRSTLLNFGASYEFATTPLRGRQPLER